MFRIIALLVVSLLIVAGAWFGLPDQQFLTHQWALSRAENHLKPLAAEAGGTGKVPIIIQLDPAERGAEAAPAPSRAGEPRPVRRAGHAPGAAVLRLELSAEAHSATARYRLDEGKWTIRRVGWYSVLPPLLAIISAILFRRVILCLSLGILAGGVVALWPMDHTIFVGAWHAVYWYLIHHSLLDQFRGEILVFILLISAIVGMAQECGGINGMILIIIRYCRTTRAAQLGTAIGGMAIFFNDYLNCIIVGNSFRPLTDRYRVSREKLSYIVDSAPRAGGGSGRGFHVDCL